MTTIEVTPERLTLVKHLANGKGIDVVATIMKMPKDKVLDIASHHGYPDREKLGKAAELMQARLDRDAAAIPEAKPQAAGTRQVPVDRQIPQPGPASPRAVPPPPPAELTRPDEIRVLLNTAKAHPAKRIQNAADRVFDALDRLRTLIREDEEKNSAKRKAEEEKAAARAEIERLEQQLAAAKAKLRGKPAAATATQPTERTSTPQVPRGEYPCRNDGCDMVKDTPQGRSLHERRHCEHRAAEAS